MFLFIFRFNSHSQVEVGGWRDHLPYAHVHSVTAGEDKVYCTTPVSMFSIDRAELSLEKMSKITGLSDVGFSVVKYSSENSLLLIAYSNANIDIISDNTVYNISAIKRKNMVGSKNINSVTFYSNYAYLACDFGIVVVDVSKKEISDTYYIEESGSTVVVNEIAIWNNTIYAATESGIYYADLDTPNLVDYSNWNKNTDIGNPDGDFCSIVVFAETLYTCFSGSSTVGHDVVYYLENGEWEELDGNFNIIFKLVANDDYIIPMRYDGGSVFNTENEQASSIYTYFGETERRIYDAEFDDEGILWIADGIYGLVRREGVWGFSSYYPDGPYNYYVNSIACENSDLWVASGEYDQNGVYRFVDESWQYYSGDSISAMEDVRQTETVCINPDNSKSVFVGTLGYGLLEFNDGQFVELYNESNSALMPVYGTESVGIRINSMAFDPDGNLWVTNSETENPFLVKPAGEDTWINFEDMSYGNKIGVGTKPGQIFARDNGDKWVIVPNSGICVFNEGDDMEDTEDDEYAIFAIKNSDGENITTTAYSIAEDDDGAVWIGTNTGVVVYYSPENALSQEDFYATQIKVADTENDSVYQYLLASESVKAIAIDGANRKWFGTDGGGVFLMSDDGTEQVEYFSTDNSSLLSNTINTIAIDNETGEVFFGTDNGIISYRATATEGSTCFKDVYVFPNPVREDYTGLVTVTGLVANVNVKIVDIAGNLVYETTAEGGQATWDGRTFSGKRVHTGVYLVLCSNEDGTKTHITKLLFIN